MDKIEISHRTIIFTVLLLISIWFLFLIRRILLLVFISIIFAAALGPLVNKLEKLKVPRALSILIFYVLFVGGLAWIIALAVPIVISQTTALVNDLPKFLNEIGYFKLNIQPSDYSSQLAQIPANVFKLVSLAFSNILGLFAFLMIAFYLLQERKHLKKRLLYLFGEKTAKKAENFVVQLEKELGGWVRAELFLMILVGTMSFIGLKILDIDFVLPLALLAGLLELVPNIGPTASMIPAALVGFASSPVLGLAVMALYVFIQQVENNIIVPQVMRRVVGLHPLVTLLALMIGFRIAGIGGSLLAVPVVLFLKVLIEQFFLPQRKKPSESQ